MRAGGFQLGTAINSCHKETMKLAYNIDRVVNAKAKAAAARAKLAFAEKNKAGRSCLFNL